MTGAPIRLLIADDHPVVRDGLSSMFASAPGFEVLGEAADGAEAVRLAQELRPDVILMDLRMPGMDGLAAITELARRGVTARVLVLTTYDTDSRRPAGDRGGRHRLPAQGRAPGRAAAGVRGPRPGARACWPPSVAARLMNRMRAPAPQLLSAARAGGPRTGRGRQHQPRGGRPAVHQRGHGQVPPAEHLRQARGQRPRRRRRRGVQPQAARSAKPGRPVTRGRPLVQGVTCVGGQPPYGGRPHAPATSPAGPRST